ncbi:MAG: hypothetical protein HRU40_06070 [Saprospiraceae bacterium]|nr:hypothetical protein [Saprospiraceae bacterium]
MKKAITLLLLFFASLLTVQAQEETLFGNNTLDLTGFWYNSRHNFSFFENEDAQYIRGGSVDFEFGRSIFLGWAWHRMRDDLFLEEGNVSFKLRHSGLKLAYAPVSDRVIHPYFAIIAGSGKINITNDNDDRIFGLTPSGGIEMNVTEWFRLGAEAGYRFITDVDVRDLDSEDFSTLFVQLQLRFGFSWGYW